MDNIYVLTSFPVLAELGGDELAHMQSALGTGRVGELLHELPSGSLVVPRMRAVPFGDLLEREVQLMNCELVNSYRQHRAIADSSTWAHLLDGSDGKRALSPRQYGLDDVSRLPEGEWFVKGETNSIKNQWLGAAYAPTTKDLVRVTGAFLADTYVGTQSVVIKPFQKYRRLATGLNSQPIFHERRVFVLDSEVLSEAFYWSSWTDELGPVSYDRAAYLETLQDAIERVEGLARFVVIDLAEYEDGGWGVVELNDGSMSGLSDNDPYTLWRNFAQVIRGEGSGWVLNP